MPPQVVFVASTLDPAGMHFATAIRHLRPFTETPQRFQGNPIYAAGPYRLVYSTQEIIRVNGLDAVFQPDVYVFLSKHRSQDNVPALTAHHPGNFGPDASFGGGPHELAPTWASLHKRYLQALAARRTQLTRYHVTTEPTHHGPTALNAPTIFVEIGSTPIEWEDRSTITQAAQVLVQVLEDHNSAESIALGIGGPHYSQKMNDVLFSTEIALASICPKYSLPHLTIDLLQQMMHKSRERVTAAVVDWKGLGPEKTRTRQLLTQAGLELIDA